MSGVSLQIETTTGGKTYERTAPFSGTPIGPAGARRLFASRLHSGGDTASYQTFSSELGSVVAITSTLLGFEEVTVEQHQFSSLKLEQTLTSMPGKATVWLDRECWMLWQIVPSPFVD